MGNTCCGGQEGFEGRGLNGILEQGEDATITEENFKHRNEIQALLNEEKEKIALQERNEKWQKMMSQQQSNEVQFNKFSEVYEKEMKLQIETKAGAGIIQVGQMDTNFSAILMSSSEEARLMALEKQKEEQILLNSMTLNIQMTQEQKNMRLLQESAKYTKQITKIQSFFRGKRSREQIANDKEGGMGQLTLDQRVNRPSMKVANFDRQPHSDIDSKLLRFYDKLEKFDVTKKECAENQIVKRIINGKDFAKLDKVRFLNMKSYYTGDWKKGVRHGYGKFEQNSQIYEGYWENNQASGYGRTLFQNGDLYEGEYFKNIAQGQGVYKTHDGVRYQGQWMLNRMNGYGQEVWTDGSVFIGTYSQGVKQGQGKFKFRDGSSYWGSFKNDEFNGYGIYNWPDGRRYEGSWASNEMDGEGEYKWPDGRSFSGSYKEGQRDGYGVFKWPNKEKYEGQWRIGKQHGEGTYTTFEGEQKKGIWKFGELQKWKLPTVKQS